jgi:hypothetical protein
MNHYSKRQTLALLSFPRGRRYHSAGICYRRAAYTSDHDAGILSILVLGRHEDTFIGELSSASTWHSTRACCVPHRYVLLASVQYITSRKYAKIGENKQKIGSNPDSNRGPLATSSE